MEIRAYLTNGDVLDFAQNDPALEAATLAEMHAARLFSGTTLIFGSGASCTILQPSAVSRIDLVAELPAPIPGTFNDSNAIIGEEDIFRLRAKAATTAFRDGIAPGEKYDGYLSLELVGGHRLMVELQRVVQQQIQFFTNINRLFEAPVMIFPHPRGGAVFVNIRNVVSVSASPGFAEYPKGALLVESR